MPPWTTTPIASRSGRTTWHASPAPLPVPQVEAIWAAIEADPTTEIVVDMERLMVEVPAAGIAEPFPMDPPTQHRFLEGLDDIALTLTHAEAIDSYESNRPAWMG